MIFRMGPRKVGTFEHTDVVCFTFEDAAVLPSDLRRR